MVERMAVAKRLEAIQQQPPPQYNDLAEDYEGELENMSPEDLKKRRERKDTEGGLDRKMPLSDGTSIRTG